jgi:hypothetical protein
MSLDGFVDRSGNVLLWCDRDSGTLYDLNGTVFGFVYYNGVFDLESRRQIGWRYGEHIRDLQGRLFAALNRKRIPGFAASFRGSISTPRTRRRPRRHFRRLHWASRRPPFKRIVWTRALFRTLIRACGSSRNNHLAAERIYAWASEQVCFDEI